MSHPRMGLLANAIGAYRAGAPATFNPAALSVGLHAWYDAKAQTASNGAAVTSLVDQSGNSRTATKTAGTITYATAGLNSLPAFDFTAGAYCDTAAFTAIASTTAIDIFAVASFAVSSGTRSLIAAASPGFSLDCGINTTWSCNRGGAYVSAGTTNTSPHRFRYFLAANGASTSITAVDGTTVAGPGSAGSGAPTAWRVGSSSSGFQNYSGKLSELLIYPGALTGTEVTGINTYLAAKWGF